MLTSEYGNKFVFYKMQLAAKIVYNKTLKNNFMSLSTSSRNTIYIYGVM
jgi:hypothetical protein